MPAFALTDTALAAVATALDASRVATAACYAGWSDEAVRAEGGADGAEFLALRLALAGPDDLAALAMAGRYLRSAFRGWSDAAIEECGAGDVLVARRAISTAEATVAAAAWTAGEDAGRADLIPGALFRGAFGARDAAGLDPVSLVGRCFVSGYMAVMPQAVPVDDAGRTRAG